jgi:hypothetical protein
MDVREAQLHVARVIDRMIKHEQERYEEAIDTEDWSLAATRRSYRNGLHQALFIMCLRFGITTEELVEANNE